MANKLISGYTWVYSYVSTYHGVGGGWELKHVHGVHKVAQSQDTIVNCRKVVLNPRRVEWPLERYTQSPPLTYKDWWIPT